MSFYSANVSPGTPHAVLAINEVLAIFVAPSDTLDATSPVTRLVTGTSWADLRAQGRRTTVTPAQRRRIDDWATAHGLQPVPPQVAMFADVILALSRQVNPAASLDLTYLGPPENDSPSAG